MPETIESFVEKLQSDGVKAGQEAAQRIKSDAEQAARQIVEEAEAKARQIEQSAETQAEQTRTRTETELKLAARDTVVRLQETLGKALQSVLTASVQEQLDDQEFLQGLIRDVVMQYVKADVGGHATATLNVSESDRQKLTQWALDVLKKDVESSGATFDLQGTLKTAGFEYKTTGGTVEVTVDSVKNILSDLTGPKLRELIQQATGGEG